MKNDPVVSEVRAARKAIEKTGGNDPKRYAERLRLLEGKYRARLVSPAVNAGMRPVAATRVAEAGAVYGIRDTTTRKRK